MVKKIKELFFAERGQAAVLVALSLTALLGFAAISVDYGFLANERRSLQNAADAAALAAAWELPNKNNVEAKGKEYAIKNASELAGGEIRFEYPNGSKEVKVDLAYPYNTFFAKVLGQDSAVISASATAEKKSKWKGEALPLFNIAYDYEMNPTFDAYGKVGPGTYGGILNFGGEKTVDENKNISSAYFEIDYENGIVIDKGIAYGDEGTGNLKVKDGLNFLLGEHGTFYIFSLRADIIRSGKFTVTTKHGAQEIKKINELNKLKRGDRVNRDQIVLLQVDFTGTWRQGQPITGLEFVKAYDLVDEFPTEHLNSAGNSSRLVE